MVEELDAKNEAINLIKNILSNWKQLRNLRLSCALPKEVDLTIYSTLRKVILTKNNDRNLIRPNGTHWITVTKMCFDPHEKSARIERILQGEF